MTQKKHMIVLPVCDADEHLAAANWSLLAYLTEARSFDAMIVVAKNRAPNSLYTLETLIRECFNSVEIFEITEDMRERRWPYPQNNMFIRTCQHLLWNKKCSSFYYMEPDITPLCKNPLEKLFAEYERAAMPMMGVKTSTLSRDGKVRVHYVNGAAIYPANIMHQAPVIVTATHTSWDVLSRDYTLGITHDGSALMAHLFRAKEFEPLPDGKMEYTDVLDGQRKVVDLSGKAVCHGCKDTSLPSIVASPRVPKKPILLADPSDVDQTAASVYTAPVVENAAPRRRLRRKPNATTD